MAIDRSQSGQRFLCCSLSGEGGGARSARGVGPSVCTFPIGSGIGVRQGDGHAALYSGALKRPADRPYYHLFDDYMSGDHLGQVDFIARVSFFLCKNDDKHDSGIHVSRIRIGHCVSVNPSGQQILSTHVLGVQPPVLRACDEIGPFTFSRFTNLAGYHRRTFGIMGSEGLFGARASKLSRHVHSMSFCGFPIRRVPPPGAATA